VTNRTPEPATPAPGAHEGARASLSDGGRDSTHIHPSPRRRTLGGGLIVFGLTGLILIGAAGALLFGSLTAVNDAATDFERQRTQILALLGPAADALDSAAASAGNAGASLAETSEAAGRAAQLTTRLAESFEGLAGLATFELLGARPFGGIAGQFSAVATESRALSSDLTSAATALGANIQDSATVAANLRVLADQLEILEASLGAPPATPSSPAQGAATLPLDLARLIVAGLLLWLAIPAVASIWLGSRFLRARTG
jgi:hypothetical protein